MRCLPASVGRFDSHFMSNAHLFELINAAPHPEAWQLNLALALARWLIFLVPVGMALAWIRGDRVARLNLLDMLLATLLALGVAQVIVHVWPQPRPFMLHLGTQLMPHADDPGLPSDHVTVFWSLALSALATERFAVWGYPLFAAGLAVGWSRVFLGVHFPYDVLAALPVAGAGVLLARALRPATMPLAPRLLALHDHALAAIRIRLTTNRRA